MSKIHFYFSFLLVLLFSSFQAIAQENSLQNEEISLMCATDPNSLPTITQLVNTTWTLKILLVEFSDVKHKSPGYTFTNFNNLFFQRGNMSHRICIRLMVSRFLEV